jgi:dTDP-4-amino-4,6-dideoxygalactose transaminase
MTLPARIPHSLPSLGEEEAEAVAAVVRSGWVKGGPRREELEQTLAADQGFAHGLATPSATHAIHLALRSRFPDGGARVAVPAYVCRSVWDAVLLSGCRPVLVDCDYGTLAINPDRVAARQPSAVIVAHVAGVRAPVEAFLQRGWFVIEDCAQRVLPGDRPTVRGALARVFSFEATKVLTSGEGGMLLLDEDWHAHRARRWRDGDPLGREEGLWLSFTDVQAALALVQWRRLPALAARRAAHQATLARALPAHRLHPAQRAPNPAPFRFLLEVPDPAVWLDDPEVCYRRPVAHGPLSACLPELATEKAPGADRLHAHLLSVPCAAALTDSQIARVAARTAERLAQLPPHDP